MHTIKCLGEVEVQSHSLIAPVTHRSERSASCRGRFNPGEGAPRTKLIRDWVGRTAGMCVLCKWLEPRNVRAVAY